MDRTDNKHNATESLDRIRAFLDYAETLNLVEIRKLQALIADEIRANKHDPGILHFPVYQKLLEIIGDL